MMCVSTIGAIVGLASWPVMQIIQDRANSFVSVAAVLMNGVAIGLVIWGLRMAQARASAQTESVWSRNAGVLDVARFVALVYLAVVVVSFIGQEARSFVEVPIGNATQIDMFSPTARFVSRCCSPLLALCSYSSLVLGFSAALPRSGPYRRQLAGDRLLEELARLSDRFAGHFWPRLSA
jgi:hypothetical protein